MNRPTAIEADPQQTAPIVPTPKKPAAYNHHWRTVTRPAALRRAGGVFSEAGKYIGQARCQRCGCPDILISFWWQHSTLDVCHLVTPPGAPGHDHEDNLAACCRKCHRRIDYASWAALFRAWLERQRIERAERLDRERPILQAILSGVFGTGVQQIASGAPVAVETDAVGGEQ